MTLRAVPDQPLAACIYGRVSMVGAREEVISPDVQVTAGRDRCATEDWSVVEQIVELDATGRTFKRRIQEAIAGVEEGRWQVIVVYRYDRFGRNVRDSLVNIARVEAAGGQVVSCTEPFDSTTAVGKYGRTNLLAVAELQSDIIGENWKAAHARRRSQGLPHGGQRRLGYRKNQKRYEPDPTWAPVVAECYRRYIDGQGLRVIANWLNQLGAPTRSSRTHGWGHNSVAHMLDTGFAAGLLHDTAGAYTDGAHEPIIDQETWQAYLSSRRQRARTPKRLLSPRSALSGVVLCAHCRRRMVVRGDARYGPHYLVLCDKDDCPARPYLLASRVDEAVVAQLRLLADDVTARAQAKLKSRERRAEVRVERRQLERRVADLDKALLRASRQVAEGLIPEAVYKQMRDELLADQRAIAEQLESSRPRLAPPAAAKARGLVRDWPILPAAARRDITAALFGVKVRRLDGGCEPVVWPLWEDEPD
jgi:DNA invertase Pin-like site-specific DNA recombinase